MSQSCRAVALGSGADLIEFEFEGKTIRATGILSAFRDRPQIVVSEVEQIEILMK